MKLLRIKEYAPLLLLLVSVGLLVVSVINRKRTQQQWSWQVRAQEEFLETLDGRQAAISATLSLRIDELAGLLPQLSEQIRMLGVKMKRVEQVQQTAWETRTDFKVALRDSIVALSPEKGRSDTLRTFNFRNDYLQVEGRARGDSQWIGMQVQDTLLQVVYRGKRIKPWLWIFSPRELLQTVRLGNPDARIRYSRRIQVRKRKESFNE